MEVIFIDVHKIFDMNTCGLSHQIKGPVIVNLTILQLKPVLANFTVGSLF